MATAEEIMAALSEDAAAKIITIDNDLRTINVPGTIKNLGVESDDDVLRLQFTMPRYYGEVDLADFVIRVNYVNANGQGDVYIVTDKTDGNDVIAFSWLVGRFAAAYKGTVRFIVCLKKVDEYGAVVQEFNTTVASLPVLEGLETTEKVAQQNPDVLEHILLRLSALEAGGGGGTGSAGGYYALNITQPDANTMRIEYTPSSSLMPAVEPQTITLPAGPQGPIGPAYELTEADKQEIVEDVLAALPAAEGVSY